MKSSNIHPANKACEQSYLTRSRRGRVEYSSLHFTRQCTVYREYDELRYLTSQCFHSLIQNLTCCVNLLLTRQKQQYIPYKHIHTVYPIQIYTYITSPTNINIQYNHEVYFLQEYMHDYRYHIYPTHKSKSYKTRWFTQPLAFWYVLFDNSAVNHTPSNSTLAHKV